MAKFYFLNYAYNPDTAATNRTLAYLKGISEIGVKTDAIFFLTDKRKSKISRTFPNITIEYYWDKWYYINNKYLKHIFYIIFLLSFYLKVKSGDTVYMYNMADMLHILLKKKGVRVFVEKTEYPGIYPLGSHIYRPSMQQYYKDCSNATGIITVSTALKSLFISKGVKADNIKIINMIVDENRFKAVKPLEYYKPYFGYCGTVSTYKDGVDDLLKAFALVHEKYPEIDLRIAGPFATEKDKDFLLNLVAQLNILDSVHFMGIIKSGVMPSFLAGATAVVLSRPDNIQAKHGFPGKLGEYLLSKSPTIVTAVGDIPLFVQDNINGFIVCPNDIKGFAMKMLWIIEHPAESKSIGEAGAELAHNKFNYFMESKKLIKFLNV